MNRADMIRKSRILSLFLVVVFAAAVVLCGCGNSKAYDEAKQQLAKLQSENQTLKDRVKTLEDENKKLTDDNKKGIEDLGALKRRLTDAGIAETPEQGNFDTCKENLKKVATALELYASDNKGAFPKKLAKMCPNPKYLEFIPTCPSVSKDTYSDGYDLSKDKKTYTVYCLGKNHENVFVKENYPAYNKTAGLEVENIKKEDKKEDE
ncbi:MAG: hypothetical protein AB9903_04850 [Vulcanimicrobiota bacterium]